MDLTRLVQLTNKYLAGELLSYEALKPYYDAVIDEINAKLNSKFPAFSEFNSTDHTQYPEYNFFPDKYLRSVVALGAAAKFYITDEEGIDAAPRYDKMYTKNLFYMERDWADQVPAAYQDTIQGAITNVTDFVAPDNIFW